MCMTVMTVNPVIYIYSAIQLFGSSALAKSMKVTERSRERSQLDTLGSELRSHWQGPRFHHDSYVSASFP